MTTTTNKNKTTTKKPSTKKVAAKKPATQKKASGPVKVKKTVAKKTVAPKTNKTNKTSKTSKKETPVKDASGVQREFDVFGYTVGSDSSTIAHALVEGTKDGTRTDLNQTIAERIEATTGLTTRNGTPKYIPSLVAGILFRLKAQGYTEETTYRLVPPADKAKAVAAAKRKAAAARK